MQTRPFGRTGLAVSALGFGAGHVGGTEMSEDEAGTLLNRAVDLGVTFFDTARGYGLSEARIGRHLSYRRSDFVLATKCGYGVEGHEDWTPGCVAAGVDEALRRLRTDYIDVVLFHSCPRDVLARPGLIEALEDAVKAGKVRVAGYSGENEDLAYALSTGRFGAIECSVNPFDQRSLDGAVAEAARRGVGVIAKRPLGNAPWRFGERPEGSYAEAYWVRMRAMALDPAPLGWDEFALRFSAFAEGVGTAIAGTSKLANLARNVAIVEQGPPPPDLVARAREAFRAHDAGWVGEV
jgi:aryl-alcohol dehydrogenase-like predicted oxidoreductase